MFFLEFLYFKKTFHLISFFLPPSVENITARQFISRIIKNIRKRKNFN